MKRNKLVDLVQAAAEHAAPDTLDLWPTIRARIEPTPAARSSRRWVGVLTVFAAVILVAAVALVILSRDDDPKHNVQSEWAAAPQDQTLCANFPQYCVPLVGAEAGRYSPELANLETSASRPNVDSTYTSVAWQTGVVRGISADGTPFIGTPNAPIRVLLFTDPACPHCQEYFAGDLKRFIEDYVLTGQAVLELRLLWGTGWEDSERAAQAAYCAGEQGAFWEMVNTLFALLQDHPASEAFALDQLQLVNLGSDFDMSRYGTCLYAERYAGVLTANNVFSSDLGVTGVPSVFVKNKLMDAWSPVERDYATLAELVQGASGLTFPLDFTEIRPEDINTDMTYIHSGQLALETPRDDYRVDSSTLPKGWLIVQAVSDSFVPNLFMDGRSNDGTTLYYVYRSNEGVLLIDNSGPAQVYDILVEGHLTTLAGTYRLEIRPILDPPVLESGQQISLQPGMMQVFKVETGSPFTFRVIEGVADTEIALGATQNIARFAATQDMQITASLPALVAFHTVTACVMNCEASGEVVLEVTLGTPGTTPAPSDELGGTLILPSNTVAVSIPQGSYVASGDPGAYVGQYVDVYASIPANADALTDEQRAEIGGVTVDPRDTTEGQPAAAMGPAVRITAGALVVSAGPYLAPFSNADPNLDWATADHTWSAITLAVRSIQEAEVIQWATDNHIPLIVHPATASYGDLVELSLAPEAVEQVSFGLQADDTVTIGLPGVSNVQFHQNDDNTVSVEATYSDLSSTLGQAAAVIEKIDSGEDGSMRLTVRANPTDALLLNWAVAQGVPLMIQLQD